MTTPFDACSLADLSHELQLAARDASGSALCADVMARIMPCLLDQAHTKSVLLRHPRVGGSNGLVCSAAADSKQAWCSMLRDLFLGAGISVSDAAQLRVYLLIKQWARRGYVRLPQAGSPVAIVQFNMRSGGGFEKQFTFSQGQGQGNFQAKADCDCDSEDGMDGDCAHMSGEKRGHSAQMQRNIGACCCVANPVCARMSGGSLESLRLLDYRQNRHWPATHVIEIASGRWCLQLFAALEQLHGSRVFSRVCSVQGAALVRMQLAPAAQRLRLRTLVPVYDMVMGHMQRLRVMCCGGRGKLALLMSQGWGDWGPEPRDCTAMMDLIVRRVAAAQVAVTPEGMHAKAQALSAVGECAAAAALLQQAVGHGHLPSRADLADLLVDGKFDGRQGVTQDENRAFALVKESPGCHHCQGVMASCYWSGLGCSKDAARSISLARASAAGGSKYGQRMLGVLYYKGEAGVAQDYAAAVEQYRLAAAQGYDRAQCDLGRMYSKGYGVAQDHAEALRWIKLAAAQGLGAASCIVGFYYEMGRGVAADKLEAIRWYKRAHSAGYSLASKYLIRLVSSK